MDVVQKEMKRAGRRLQVDSSGLALTIHIRSPVKELKIYSFDLGILI